MSRRRGLFSRRSQLGGEPHELARQLLEARREGRQLIDLTGANPTRVGLEANRRRLASALGGGEVQRYAPESLGDPTARAAVVARCSSRPGSGPLGSGRQVLLTASTSEAYALLFKLLCDPGDRVLVPQPSYPLLEHLASLEGVRLGSYRLAYAGGWFLDVPSLKAACDERTRAIVAVSPNNPTGSYLSRGELDALAGFGLPLIVDEVFAGYPLTDAGPGPCALEVQDRVPVFCLGGLSKEALLPQLKCAWTIVGAPAALLEPILRQLEIIADAYLSVATPVQQALPQLLELGDELRARALARARSNLLRLRNALTETSASVLSVEGGWYATLRLASVFDEDELSIRLLRERGVLVQPGWLYDFAEAPRLVVSLLTEPTQLEAGVGALVELLDA